MKSVKEHWENVYDSILMNELGWYQESGKELVKAGSFVMDLALFQ